MHEHEISAALAGLPLGGLRFFPSIGSTNDEAFAWAAAGAPDLAIVVADEQTAGRGRAGRKWFTPPGAALAVSIILRLTAAESPALAPRLTGLAAVALVQAFRKLGLQPRIKWPNDVLLGERKVAGILAESAWAGNQLEAAVIGVGVNITPAAVPPPEQLSFPATSLEHELQGPADRLVVLRDMLQALIEWRGRLGSPDFFRAWDQALAYRGEQVTVSGGDETPLTGTLLGLLPDGSLQLKAHDKLVTIHFGEIRLRPGNDKIS